MTPPTPDVRSPGAEDGDGPSAAQPDERRGFRWRRLWPLALVGAAMVTVYLSGVHEYVSLRTVIREHEALAAAVEANILLVAAAYLAVYALAVAVSFPGASLITVVGGFLFGAFIGTVLTVLAATAGASVIFLAARTSVGEPLRARAGRSAQRLAEGFEENAFSYLLFLRLVPLFPFWLINVAPALFNVPLRVYMVATAIGIVPGTFAYTLLGDGLGAAIEAQEAANPGCARAGTCEIEIGALFTPGLIAALVLLAVASLAPVAVKQWRARRRAGR
jgi:uncharacterized membrane protein YdjX (TVP38/TMEM64 family)